MYWNLFVGGAAAPVAAAAPAGGAAAAAAPAAEEKKEEVKEESDDDMGFSLFDWGAPITQPLANLLMLSKTILCYVSRVSLQVIKFCVFLRLCDDEPQTILLEWNLFLYYCTKFLEPQS